MNTSTENFTSTEVYPSTIIQETLLVGFRIALLGFNILFGLPTHSYVLWLIARGRRIPSEFFNVNLTVCEIIYCLMFFFYILQILPSLQHFLQGLGVTGRPLFQCLICVERYLAVVHPVTFLKYKPLRYRVICCTAVWILTFGSCLGIMIILLLNLMKTYAWFISVQFILYFSIQLFCLVAVLRALQNHMKRRAFHLILITTVTLIVMIIPFISAGFLTILQQKEYKDVPLIWARFPDNAHS